MIRVGAFDEFGESRTAQFWEVAATLPALRRPADRPARAGCCRPRVSSVCPRCRWPSRRAASGWNGKRNYFDFAVSGHPLELHDEHRLGHLLPGLAAGPSTSAKQVVTCGLVVEQRTHHQVTGEPMKFLTLADWTGMVETELFAATYRTYGLVTVRYPVLEIAGRVEPFENGRGFTLRVLRASKPRFPIIVTRNIGHLKPAESFGIEVLTPAQFLGKLRAGI